MPRPFLIAALLVLSTCLFADDQSLWREYGLVQANTSQEGKLHITSYRMKDPTGALAAWQWLRPTDGRSCDLAPLCSHDADRTVISDFNYVLVFEGGAPLKAQVDSIFKALPDKHDSSLPAILTFLPTDGLVPNSSRYVLGPASFSSFAPELNAAKPGFETGAEAQVADYRVGRNTKPVRLAIFYYATPEMARLHSAELKRLPGVQVKRSGVLVAVVSGFSSPEQADTVLSRVQYKAKVTWNDTPPPSPIRPLYRLLVNILYLSGLLSVLCLAAGLFYAGMRLYRRRYGSLDSEEAMTTLHLSGD